MVIMHVYISNVLCTSPTALVQQLLAVLPGQVTNNGAACLTLLSRGRLYYIGMFEINRKRWQLFDGVCFAPLPGSHA